ncbi:uncharacterized protein LOC111702444 isoform X2 [Eurytemora carolleeae]|uniref:uncharacterized protein LOC111702444 isoform X2 n=1 Tax=Eurytemora carolleeae TaxID=1294199 RepID=UPI000C78AC41|nr:uncharacterized protein LOC111702444 isoform X2 [Eurytemora carolleeae]|eukprot:XP_023329900.1 uncharacterized protein LOC111702444 isoform X2 [Eurytemora affinis]
MLNLRTVNLDSSYKIGSLQVEVHPGGVVTPRKESAEQNTKMRELSQRTVLRELSPVSVRMVGGGGGQQTRSRETSPRDLKLVHNHRIEKEPDLEYEIDHCIEQRYSNSNTWTNQNRIPGQCINQRLSLRSTNCSKEEKYSESPGLENVSKEACRKEHQRTQKSHQKSQGSRRHSRRKQYAESHLRSSDLLNNYEEDEDEDIRCTGCLAHFNKCLRLDGEDKEDIVNTEEEKAAQTIIKIQKHFKDDDVSPVNMIDSNLSTCILFLGILVLLLILTFLTFRLSGRVESLESVCSQLSDYLELLSENRTESNLLEERKNPGIIKGKQRKSKGYGNS